MAPSTEKDTSTSTPTVKPETTKFGVGPVSVELCMPRWAIACISIVIICLSAAAGSWLCYAKIHDIVEKQKIEIATAKNSVTIPKDQLLIYTEQQKHAGDEEPGQAEHTRVALTADGTVTVHHFYSDGCVEIIRNIPGKQAESKWMFGANSAAARVSFSPETSEKPGIVGTADEQLRSTLQNATEALRSDVHYAKSGTPNKPRLQLAQLGGRCIDPHPGTFQVSSQPVNECLAVVTRVFYDGCSHQQMFNACTGTWDVWPNGLPKVNWIRCIH
jgi:hypothetical protein